MGRHFARLGYRLPLLIRGVSARGRFYRLLLLIAGAAAAGLVAWAGAGESASSAGQVAGDELVEMTIVHSQFKSKVRVPLVYLGPRFLELSKKNRLGGEQKRFLIEFYYPSMLPNTPENSHLKETEVLTYASITNAAGGVTRRLGLGNTESEGAPYEATGREVCELKEFKSKPNWVKRNVFYYKDISSIGDDNVETENDNIYTDDVLIYCSDSDIAIDMISRCRWTFETKRDLIIVLNAIPEDRLCEWPELTNRLRALADSFVVKNEEGE